MGGIFLQVGAGGRADLVLVALMPRADSGDFDLDDFGLDAVAGDVSGDLVVEELHGESYIVHTGPDRQQLFEMAEGAPGYTELRRAHMALRGSDRRRAPQGSRGGQDEQ